MKVPNVRNQLKKRARFSNRMQRFAAVLRKRASKRKCPIRKIVTTIN